MAPAFREGADAVRAIEPSILALWMIRIYYGLLFKELALPLDRRDPKGEKIVDPELLRVLGDLHMVLQARRKKVRIEQLPASLFIFDCQVPSARAERFDYRDTLSVPYLAIRVGSVAVLGHLLDWGAMRGLQVPGFQMARSLELHPIQFTEVAALGAYVATLFKPDAAVPGCCRRGRRHSDSPNGRHEFQAPVRQIRARGVRPSSRGVHRLPRLGDS